MDWEKTSQSTFIVFLRGSGVNHTIFRRLGEILSDNGYNTLLIDQRCFGLSLLKLSKRYYSLSDYSNDIKIILEKEGIKRPIFVAHSFSLMPAVDYIHSTKNAKVLISICGSPGISVKE